MTISTSLWLSILFKKAFRQAKLNIRFKLPTLPMKYTPSNALTTFSSTTIRLLIRLSFNG